MDKDKKLPEKDKKPDEKKPVDQEPMEQYSDGSGGAFGATEEVSDHEGDPSDPANAPTPPY